MTEYHAKLVQAPYQRVLGSALEVDVDATAIRLPVETAAAFNDLPRPDGLAGHLRVRLSQTVDDATDVIAAYTGWDGDAEDTDSDTDELNLTASLGVAAPAGTPVDVWNVLDAAPNTAYACQVILNERDPGEAVEVAVDPNLVDAWATGTEDIPDAGESVVVFRDDEIGDDDLTLTRVLGNELRRDGGFIDPETVPVPEDVVREPVAPPSVSPGVTVTGVTDGLVLTLTDPIEGGARVTFHLSADQAAGVNFVPSAATAVTALTASGVVEGSTLTDGTPLVEGTTYYARVVAENGAGVGPAGPGASGSPDRSRPRELIAVTLTALKATLERLEVGQGSIDATDGIKIPHPQSDGSIAYSRIPFDGSPVELLAMLTAITLAVQGRADFLGAVWFGRRVTFGDGVSAPGEPATLVPGWPTVPVAAPSNQTLGGLAVQPGSSTRLLVASHTPAAPEKVQLLSVLKSSGGLPNLVLETTEIVSVTGLAVGGGRYWMLGRDANGVWKLVGISTTDTADVVVKRLVVHGFGGAETGPREFRYRPTLGVSATGGSLLLAFVAPGSGGGNQLIIETYTSSDATFGQAAVMQQNVTVTDLAWVGNGEFNLPGSRYVVQPASADAMVWSGNLAGPVRQNGESFPRANGATIAGMVWDNVRFRALHGYSIGAGTGAARIAATSMTVTHAWAGTASNGAIIETNAGPSITRTIDAQAQALVTIATPPEADLTATGTANRATVYATLSNGEVRRQAVLSRGVRAVNVDNLATGGRLAGATGVFTSAPADLVPERGATDADKGWIARGSGYMRIGDLERRTDGTMAAGPAFFAALAAYAAGFRAANNTQSIPAGGAHPVALAGTPSHTSPRITRSGTVITVLDAGLYNITAYTRFGASTAGARIFSLLVNGVAAVLDQKGGQSGSLTMSVSVDIPLAAGSTLELTVTQSTSGALLLNDISQLNVRRIG